MEREILLEARGLSYTYDGKKTIFSDVSFSLHAGEVFVILGANGAGKSTLLNCISNMLTPTQGEVLLTGTPIGHYPVAEVARKMGYVPQISVPSFSYTVRDYIVMGRAPHMGLLAVPGAAEYAQADAVMEEMGISALADKVYSSISGGERQQAQIARVLVQGTPVVLLDEPTNHLDYGNQLKILGIIDRLAHERGLAVILTSHMPDHAILLNGTVGILNSSGRLEVGPATQVISEERLKDLYHTDLHLVYIEQLQRMACVAGKPSAYRAESRAK